ncbi:tetratricopeptide repeat protein [Cyanobium sp. ATX 6F1]|uniref:O-linked N-acetylglucosamine transferase, SPINDLY family protein n=1 Tax=unclassified Cyanobium TaxID=2627006 RepID=UPI0020CF0924|nr:tetratricopeptide repeat protein [Cyanobium sp. ATX 6F1]MCP9915169.1 tetratricopeptide repeat protein [Cyanobium sp. ATX 6F1]
MNPGEEHSLDHVSDQKQATSYYCLGNDLLARGDHSQAIEAYGLALSIRPEYPEALNNLGNGLKAAGRLDEAMVAYQNALKIQPDLAVAQFNLGNILKEQGRLEEASMALLGVLLLKPDMPKAHLLLAEVLEEIGDLEQAAEGYLKTIRLEPSSAEAWRSLGGIHRLRGLLDEAIKCFDRALELLPGDWLSFTNLMFCYSIGGREHQQLLLETSERYWREIGVRTATDHYDLVWALVSGQARPLRIGFLGRHCDNLFLNSFLRHYSRNDFSVDLIFLTRNQSMTSSPMGALVSEEVFLDGLTLSECRDLLLRNKYDIIVETSGYLADSGIQILAERCAPVQCHYIGFHASTGLHAIDYFICDSETGPPEFEDVFSETLWRLPRPWLACTFSKRPPLALPQAWGEEPVFGSFNQLTKVRQDTLNHWAAALRAVPNAILLIKGRHAEDLHLQQRILSTLRGLDVEEKRIGFLPATATWEEHMATYNRIDLALDTTPWSSATTGFDALAMGVPLVAIKGDCMAARMSSSLVSALNRGGWVASSPEDYARIVINLCANLNDLRSAKAARQSEFLASCLFDGADLSHHLQEAFQEMSRRAYLHVQDVEWTR